MILRLVKDNQGKANEVHRRIWQGIHKEKYQVLRKKMVEFLETN